MKTLKSIILITGLLAILFNCTTSSPDDLTPDNDTQIIHQNEDDTNDNSNENTNNNGENNNNNVNEDEEENQTPTVTYSADIQNIMSSNCISCHNSNIGSTSPALNSYISTKNAIENNNLICRIKGTDCGNLMPQGGSQLPQSIISKIEQWQTENFPEN